MPAPGTKLINIGGRDFYLPAHQVELEELVQLGLQAQARLEEAKAELAQIKARVIEMAEPQRHGRKSIVLPAPVAGAVSVTWSHDTDVDESVARELEAELPRSVFEAIFARKEVYSPRRGYQGFMKQPQTADLEKLKVKIARAIIFKPKAPAVKFTAGVAAAIAGDLPEANPDV
jgi:hypothetical protein